MAISKERAIWFTTTLAILAIVLLPGSADSQTTGVLKTHELVAGCDAVLFHSILGLRPAVRELAEALTAAGHRVATPDFFDGQTFSDYETARKALEVAGGIPRYMEWTTEVGRNAPPEAVFMGFSIGAGSAELLAATVPQAKAAVLMHGALPLERLGLAEWPSGVPVQVHYAEDDPFRNEEGIVSLKAGVNAAGAHFQYFSYPGDSHLFADRGLAEYEEESAQLMLQRVFKFLNTVCSDER